MLYIVSCSLLMEMLLDEDYIIVKWLGTNFQFVKLYIFESTRFTFNTETFMGRGGAMLHERFCGNSNINSFRIV